MLKPFHVSISWSVTVVEMSHLLGAVEMLRKVGVSENIIVKHRHEIFIYYLVLGTMDMFLKSFVMFSGVV